MNDVERILADDVARLLDRLAASIPGGTLDGMRQTMPTLRARLDDTERRLAADRAALTEAYARWRDTLGDLENLWALAAWRAAEAEKPAA